MKYVLPAVALTLCLIGLAACQEEEQRRVVQTDIPFTREGTLDFVRPDGTVIRTIDIEIADTDSARQRGLMGRRSLSLRQGMLFEFPDEDMRTFWMANTPIPLDIIFVSADSQIVNIARRTTPLSQEQVHSTDSAMYVVEVRAGFTERYGITEETRIRWQRLAGGT